MNRKQCILRFLFAFSLSSVLYAQTPEVGASLEENPSVNKVISLEHLDKMERFDQLAEYGLVAPGSSNHKSGKNLILLALKATAYFKGDWVLAHGFLGTSMLKCDVYDRLAYRSLFLSLAQKPMYKLYATTHMNNELLTDYKPEAGYFPRSRDPVIFRRESILTALAENLRGRYIFNDQGMYERRYSPETNRNSNKALAQTLKVGLAFYKDLKVHGYVDKTLGHGLGIAYASLNYDREPTPSFLDLVELGHPVQIYSDALEACLEFLRKRPGHSIDFLEELGNQMSLRGLTVHDTMLLPELKEGGDNFRKLLEIVEKDLDEIEERE